MTVPVYISVEIKDAAALSVRDVRRIRKAANRATALLWHRHYLRRHFRPGADVKYGYPARSPKYLDRKRRRASRGHYVKEGGNAPLVYSGLSRSRMMRPPTIRAYPTRARVDMAAPSYFRMTPRAGKHPLGRQATKVIENERRPLTAHNAKETERGINATRRTKKTRV